MRYRVANKPVIILGTGGHSKVVTEVLRLLNRKILGFVTPDLKVGTEFLGSIVLGDDSVIFDYSADEIELANGVGALPEQDLRWKLAAMMRINKYSFTHVVHPSAIIASDVVLENGVQIMAGVVLQPSTTIGKDTIINTSAIVDHDCTIAENCHLAPGVICSGGVNIRKHTHLGTGSKIIQGVNIGEGSVIAAGSIIYKNVPPGMMVKQKLKVEMKRIEN